MAASVAALNAKCSNDAAGLAALFATNAIVVNPLGPQTDMVRFADGLFKAGFNHVEANVDQVWTLGPDTAIGMGQARYTGKNQSGAPIEALNFWTATYVQEGGKVDQIADWLDSLGMSEYEQRFNFPAHAAMILRDQVYNSRKRTMGFAHDHVFDGCNIKTPIVIDTFTLGDAAPPFDRTWVGISL
jgi:hypothetical protein